MTMAPPGEPRAAAAGNPTKFCRACGVVLDARAELCPHCGVRQMLPVPPVFIAAQTPKNRQTAAILAILLDGFGAHKFYLDQSAVGVIYLLFCWTLIPLLLGIVEGVIYLTETDEDFYRKHAKVW